MNKIVTLIAILAIIFLAGILYLANTQDTAEGSGQVSVGISSTQNVDRGSISEITMEVSEFAVYRPAEGWTELAAQPRAVELLSLHESGQTELWGETNLTPGSYDRARVVFDQVEIMTDDGTTTEAILPGRELLLDAPIEISETGHNLITLQIEADRSLLTAEDESWVFAPVTVLELRQAVELSEDEDGRLSVTGGTVTAAISAGMDLEGQTQANFSVSPQVPITVESDGSVSSREENEQTEQEDEETADQEPAEGEENGNATTTEEE